MVTPFNEDGQVDFAGLEKLVNHLIDGNTNYLVVMGTTGESVTLSKDEKQVVLDKVLEVNQGRLPVVLGVGGNNTAEVAKNFGEISSPIDGILSVSPYYNKPTQKGIIEHYKVLASATDLPIILYNVPGRTSSNIEASTTLELAQIDNIVAIKEASGDLEQTMNIINGKPDNFDVISGDDALTLPFVAAGGAGLISVVGNAFPLQTSELIKAAAAGDRSKALRLNKELLPIIPLLFAEGNPAGVKEVLKHVGVCDHHVRLPLVNVSTGLAERLKLAANTLHATA